MIWINVPVESFTCMFQLGEMFTLMFAVFMVSVYLFFISSHTELSSSMQYVQGWLRYEVKFK